MNQRQVNIRMDEPLFRALESLARQDKRTVPQTARLLLEEGMRSRAKAHVDDLSGLEIAVLAQSSGSFDWLGDEPNIYDASCGEPI